MLYDVKEKDLLPAAVKGAKNFKKNLKRLVAPEGELPQSELARRSGVSQPGISMTINGDSVPEFANVIALSIGLGISIEALCADPSAPIDRDFERLKRLYLDSEPNLQKQILSVVQALHAQASA